MRSRERVTVVHHWEATLSNFPPERGSFWLINHLKLLIDGCGSGIILIVLRIPSKFVHYGSIGDIPIATSCVMPRAVLVSAINVEELICFEEYINQPMQADSTD
jgi:hypothetical protein